MRPSILSARYDDEPYDQFSPPQDWLGEALGTGNPGPSAGGAGRRQQECLHWLDLRLRHLQRGEAPRGFWRIWR